MKPNRLLPSARCITPGRGSWASDLVNYCRNLCSQLEFRKHSEFMERWTTEHKALWESLVYMYPTSNGRAAASSGFGIGECCKTC